jgi:hypothetical protein
MPSPKQLAKALARQDSVTKQPRNRFLGAVADAAGYLSDQADRYVVPERDPLFGGMRGGDLLPLRNVNRLLDDLSYGGRITTGRGQTTTLRPEVVDLTGVTGAMMPAAKNLGKAALREGARQIETGTGIGRAALDPRTRMFAGEGAKTADKGALKVAKDMKAAGVPDEQIHAKTKWTFAFADGKPRFEIDDSAAKVDFPAAGGKSSSQDAYDVINHRDLQRAYPNAPSLKIVNKDDPSFKGAYYDQLDGITVMAPDSAQAKSTTLHELQHAIQQREGFARGGDIVNGPYHAGERNKLLSEQVDQLRGLNKYDPSNPYSSPTPTLSEAEIKQMAIRNVDSPEGRYKAYHRLAGETEARLTQSRMNMTAAERAASYPPSMFDVPVKDQIVRYGDGQAMSVPERNGVGGAMIQRPKTTEALKGRK